MQVIVRYMNQAFTVKDVSKAMDIRKFKQIVGKVINCDVTLLQLFCKGKIMVDCDDLLAYRVENGNVIDAIKKQIFEDEPSTSKKVHDETKVAPKDEEIDKELENCIAEIEAQENNNEELEPQPPCQKCKDNPKKLCRECGCQVCGGKTPEERLIFCEECQYVTHFECLQDPIETLPEGDFYCDECRVDTSEIVVNEQVRYGSKRSKMPSRKKNVKRDWGRGMATAGRTKECLSVDKHHFGPIPGIEVGMSWQYRIQLSEVGVHRPPVGGIAGSAEKGCQSIVLAGGYEDDTDWGEGFFYTGCGGKDLSGNKRTNKKNSFDQELTRYNKAIALNCNAKFDDKKGAEADNWKKGKPIRVCRSAKQKHSKFAPEKGVRYDGIYKVVKYWPHIGKSGFRVWRYEFQRDDPNLPPWDPKAPKFDCIMKSDEDAKENSKNKINVINENSQENKTGTNVYVMEEKLKTLIKMDTRNKKLWDELMDKKVTKFEWYQEVEEAFKCPTCFELMFVPVTLACSHNICELCMKRGETFGECFSCRYKLSNDFSIKANLNLETQKIMNFMFKTGEDAPLKNEKRKAKKRKLCDENENTEADEPIIEAPKEKVKMPTKSKETKTNEEESPNSSIDLEINGKSTPKPQKPCPKRFKKSYDDF